MKAATIKLTVDDVDCYISIHAAREGGDLIRVAFRDFGNISIHAAREGGDFASFAVTCFTPLFQSTPPVKAATAKYNCLQIYFVISIHAAREGGDDIIQVSRERGINFNPRRP